jgi:hypothetical protein
MSYEDPEVSLMNTVHDRCEDGHEESLFEKNPMKMSKLYYHNVYDTVQLYLDEITRRLTTESDVKSRISKCAAKSSQIFNMFNIVHRRIVKITSLNN